MLFKMCKTLQIPFQEGTKGLGGSRKRINARRPNFLENYKFLFRLLFNEKFELKGALTTFLKRIFFTDLSFYLVSVSICE